MVIHKVVEGMNMRGVTKSQMIIRMSLFKRLICLYDALTEARKNLQNK
jgi:hypothetical protein